MRVAVLGATGGVGQLVLTRAAQQPGWQVVAGARRPEALTAATNDLGVEVMQADVTDATSVAALIRGCDALVSALGHGPGRHAHSFYSTSARAITTAMATTGVPRLVIISAAAFVIDLYDGPVSRFLVKPLLMAVLRDVYTDIAAMEDVVQHSGLQWTIVRPARLVDGVATGQLQSARGHNVPGAFNVTRADVANFMVDTIADETSHQAVICVA